jgi:hypothetical protein
MNTANQVPQSKDDGKAYARLFKAYARLFAVIGLFLFLVVVLVMLVATLIQMWPPTPNGVGPLSTNSPVKTHWLWWNVTLTSDAQLFVVVSAAGALGSEVHALRSLFRYVGNDKFRYRWVLMYCTLPFTGAALALITYLLLRGGLTSSNVSSGAVNPYGVTAIGALVGLFSDQAVEKFKQVFSTLLAQAPQGKDPIAPVEVQSVDPLEGPVGTVVTIKGTGLGEVTHVKFGNSQQVPVTSATDVQVVVKVPADAETGLVTVLTPDRTKTSTPNFTVT